MMLENTAEEHTRKLWAALLARYGPTKQLSYAKVETVQKQPLSLPTKRRTETKY